MRHCSPGAERGGDQHGDPQEGGKLLNPGAKAQDFLL